MGTDTVLDFNPQGPVDFCVSSSGVMYTLDSEGVHSCNILQVQSHMRGEKGESRGLPDDTTLRYQTLFTVPQNSATRSSSQASVYGTDQNTKTELWDAYTGEGWRFGGLGGPSVAA